MVYSVALVIIPALVALVVVRKYREHSWGRCKSKNSLKGRVFLITGANSGVGKETAKQLAERHASVILACRNMEATRLAIKEIRSSVSSGELIPMLLDLGSFESIKKFSAEVLKDFPKVHVLINNAGVYYPLAAEERTTNGFELNFGINHLGHFLLTNLLMDRIKTSAPSRIVIVSSGLHERGQIDVNDLNMDKRRQQMQNNRVNAGYCASKLANVYHGRELAKQLKGTGVDVYCLCPGFTYTGLFRYSSVKWWQYLLFAPVAFFYMRSSWQGSQTVMLCATADTLPGGGKSGDFFRNCQLYKSTVNFDEELQTELWSKCEELVKS